MSNSFVFRSIQSVHLLLTNQHELCLSVNAIKKILLKLSLKRGEYGGNISKALDAVYLPAKLPVRRPMAALPAAITATALLFAMTCRLDNFQLDNDGDNDSLAKPYFRDHTSFSSLHIFVSGHQFRQGHLDVLLLLLLDVSARLYCA
jgi:hypothetical protein